jgi:hypothetical protein
MAKKKSNGLEVKYYWSPDIGNPWEWMPHDNEVLYLLEMSIGIVDATAADIYSVTVATPEGISRLDADSRYFSEISKILLIKQYSWMGVTQIIDSVLSGVDASSQLRIQEDLGKYFHWEYQSMKTGN